MDGFLKYFDFWELKLGISILTLFFSPFYMSLTILFILIIIDTVAGGYYAYKARRFTSKGFRKSLFKLLTYFISIFVVRLLEMGISELINTEAITNLMTSYLVVTEVLSVLRNLTLLGAPLPSGLTRIIIKQIKNQTLEELFESGNSKQEYIQEIKDMIEYQVPTVKCFYMREYLIIKLNEWAQFINIFESNFSSSGSDNEELLFHRVMNLINITIQKVSDRTTEAEIPAKYVECIDQWHRPVVERVMRSIKAICYSDEPLDKKKNLIIEKIIIGLYKTITDIQKIEVCDRELINTTKEDKS